MTTQQAPVDTPVLVVGGGPVGAVLALELAHHGVPCVLVERATTPSRHPKMDYVNGRSMELLRRLGVAAMIRARGISADHRANFLWSRSFAEAPVHVWDHPSVTELTQRYADRNDGSVPVETYQRVQGSLLEDLVRGQAREHPLVDLREGWSFVDLDDAADDEAADAVVVTVEELATGTRHRIRAGYLVGCDGANSAVRRRLDIGVDAAGPSTHHCSVYFRSADPLLRRHGRAFVTVAAHGLTLVSRDEQNTWTGSLLLPDAEPFTADPVAVMRERLGADFAVDEVLSVARWTGQLAVATAYRRGRVFLAGDSAHHFYPTGGHGANTGLADAVDLGWKLAATVSGWGGPGLLDSYEAERRPVATFNAEMCANLMEVWRRFGRMARAGVSREHLAGFLAQEAHQADNVGIHFGYRYDTSPIVCHEPGPVPSWEWRRIVPTTWPGGRAPSLRLADGSHLHDRLGRELTLVDLSGTNAGERMAKEAERQAIPVTYLPIDDPAVRACWERDLVLVRPDHHVAWRGDSVPDGLPAVFDRVCGH